MLLPTMASGGGQWIRELLAQSIARLREKMEGQEVLRQEDSSGGKGGL